MSELRQDPFTDRWVVIAPNRAARPHDFTLVNTRRGAIECPFCAGNETETPPDIARYPAPGGDRRDWQVRVVPNKYPAVSLPDGDGGVEGSSGTDLAGVVGRCQAALGAQEVIIESPDHVASFSELTELQAELSFLAYRDRLSALGSDPRLVYGLIFKNAGVDAGASLEHVHSQLIALSWIPPDVQYELTKAREHRALRGATLMQEVLEAELADGRRIVETTERFVVFCPAASRFPFETWIVPRVPAPRFELETRDVVAETSRLARGVIVRLERLFDRPAFNYWLHSGPFGDASGHVHWRVEIAPRLARMAGFEIGGGCFINPVAPEDAAVQLR